MKNLKPIMDEYNHSVDFPLFDTALTVSAKRNVYNELRKKYSDLAYSAMDKFKEYNTQFRDLNDLIASAPGALILSLEEALTEVSQDAISVGLYTLDSDTIVAECFGGGHFDDFTEAYNAYISAQDRITANLGNAAQYRNARKQSRGRWSSMTFGGNAFNAWGNQLKAGAMNVTEGVGHSIANAFGNAWDEMKAEESMKELFKSSQLRNTLINAVWYCCNNLRMVVTNIVSQQSNLNLGGWVSSADSTKADAIFKNLMNTNLSLPLEQQHQLTHEIISLNPYDSEYYVGFLQKFSDSDLQIMAIADFFYIHGMKEEAQKSLVGFVNNNIGNTEEDAHKCQKALAMKAERLGLNSEDCREAYKLVETRLAKLDLEYRTVDGIVFDTRELADVAKKELAEILKIEKSLEESLPELQSVESLTPENLLLYETQIQAAKEQISAFATAIKNRRLEDMDAILIKLDLAYRTVDGVVLETRESADATRKDVVTYQSLFEQPHTEFIFKREYLTHIEKIRQLPIAEPLKAKYVAKYEKHLLKFDKKCEDAAKHESRSKHRNPFWDGSMSSTLALCGINIAFLYGIVGAIVAEEFRLGQMIGLIVGLLLYWLFVFAIRSSDKGDWEKVTHNGKYSLKDIMLADSLQQEIKTNKGIVALGIILIAGLTFGFLTILWYTPIIRDTAVAIFEWRDVATGDAPNRVTWIIPYFLYSLATAIVSAVFLRKIKDNETILLLLMFVILIGSITFGSWDSFWSFIPSFISAIIMHVIASIVPIIIWGAFAKQDQQKTKETNQKHKP